VDNCRFPNAKKGDGCPSPFSISSAALFGCDGLQRVYGDVDPAIALGCERDFAFDHSKDCVIRANADVLAGMPSGAALTAEDVAGDDVLTTELLDAEAASSGVATVAG
jgi:hypothetical protein